MRLRFLVVGPKTCAAGPDLTGYLASFDAEVVRADWRPEAGEHDGDFAGMLRESQPCDAVIVTASCSQALRESVEIIRETLGDIPVILSGDCAELSDDGFGEDLIYTGPAEGFPFALRTFGFRLRKRRSRREE